MNSKPTGQMEVQAELDRIRTERQPTRRGILLCCSAMAHMMQIGWPKSALDSLEILWWSVRDGNGELLPSHLSEHVTKSSNASYLTQNP